MLLEHATVLTVLVAWRQLVVVVCKPLQFVMFLFESLLLVENLNLSEPTELLTLLFQYVEEHKVLTFIICLLRTIGAARAASLSLLTLTSLILQVDLRW